MRSSLVQSLACCLLPALMLVAPVAGRAAVQEPPGTKTEAPAEPEEPSAPSAAPSADAADALERARDALREGDAETAVALFRQAVVEQPESLEARLALAEVLGRLGRAEEAREQYQRAAETHPTAAEPRVGLGFVFFAQQRLPEALVEFRQGIALDPRNEEAWLGESRVLYEQGEYRQVRDRLEEARELLPESERVSYGLAWILAASPDPSLRDGERAHELAETLFGRQPSLPKAELVGEALAEQGRCQEAADWLRGLADRLEESAELPALSERLERQIERFSQGPPCNAPAEDGASEDDASED